MLTIKVDFDPVLGKIAIGALKDGLDIILPTFEIGKPFLDKLDSIHSLGASLDLPSFPNVDFFNGFLWDFELHNIVLPKIDLDFKLDLPSPSNLTGLCGPFQVFFNDGCEECDCPAPGLLGVFLPCVRPGDCTNFCADPECGLCPNSWSQCDACDVSGNVILDLISNTCECVAGFFRDGTDSPCAMVGTEECTSLFNMLECEICLPGTESWFGGCKRCKENFFLQPSEEACMAKCPTGFLENLGIRRSCDLDIDIGGIIASIIFPDNDTQWPFLGLNGRFEAPLLPINWPTLLPNRGLYFDGFSDFMRMYDIRLNFQMTIHAWVHIFGDTGYVFSFETASPQTTHLTGNNELGIKFDLVDGIQNIFGVWDGRDSSAAPALGF